MLPRPVTNSLPVPPAAGCIDECRPSVFPNFVGVELDFFPAQQVYENYQDTGETTEVYLARKAGACANWFGRCRILNPSGSGRIDKNNLFLRAQLSI
jgi:hypothetical protein